MNASTEQVILFDGPCNLCNALVRFVIKHDPYKRFFFMPIDSEAGKTFLSARGLDADDVDSVMLVRGDEVLFKSDAAIVILAQLKGLGWVAKPLKLLPKTLRDPLYDMVARNRYRWFGKQGSCPQPNAEVADRFRF